jgi:hypothetical protein
MSITDVTQLVLQWSQPSGIVISVLEMVKHEFILFKIARLGKKNKVFNLQEWVVKRVTFDLLIITKNELEPRSPKGTRLRFLWN